MLDLSDHFFFTANSQVHFVIAGQKEANPLLLLGQYSDDELEEQVIEQPNQAANDSSTVPSGLVTSISCSYHHQFYSNWL